MATTFTAKYRGQCASSLCDRAIAPGDDITRVDQLLMHDECALDPTGAGDGSPAPITRKVCQDCFTEVSISGACSC